MTPTAPRSIAAIAPTLRHRRVTWREGSRGPQAARFAAVRVRTAHGHRQGTGPGAEVWLVSEWSTGEPAPTKFYLSSLPPKTSLRTLVRFGKLRWRIERDYQELKGELGLDHFEGRTWNGFHHHVALCATAHAFLAIFPTVPLTPAQGANIEQVAGAVTQTGTQFDALGHFSHLQIPGDPSSAVYHNGFLQPEVKPTADSHLLKLGMDKAAPIITTAVLLDAKAHFGRPLNAGEVITAADLRAMLASQRMRPILPGDVVMVRTGWERHWQDPDVNHIYSSGGPGLSEDAARFLAAKRVVAIGMDAPFIDPNPPPPPSPPLFIPFIVHHVALVESGIHLIENMRLAELATDRVWVSALLPVRIVGASGSPVRPVAIGVPQR